MAQSSSPSLLLGCRHIPPMTPGLSHWSCKIAVPRNELLKEGFFFFDNEVREAADFLFFTIWSKICSQLTEKKSCAGTYKRRLADDEQLLWADKQQAAQYDLSVSERKCSTDAMFAAAIKHLHPATAHVTEKLMTIAEVSEHDLSGNRCVTTLSPIFLIGGQRSDTDPWQHNPPDVKKRECST